MKVTIDSSEPLADALRVIGALYNVRIGRLDEGEAPAAPTPDTVTTPQRPVAKANRSRRATTKVSAPTSAASPRRSSQTTAGASTSAIRSWAVANGHNVKRTGTLPAHVKAAYAAAHAG